MQMYLMDSIARIAADPTVTLDEPILWIFPDLYRRMAGAPRFLLDLAATQASVELTLGRPRILLDALAHVRVPYPVMWVEWEESGRDRLRREFGDDGITPDRPLPDRIGFLLETEEGGRKGTATWAWSQSQIDVPHVAPITAYFDLDSRFIETRSDRMAAYEDGALINLWRDNPVQLTALTRIWETVHHKPSEWGEEFFALMAQSGRHDMRYLINSNYCDVVGEYIDIWAIILLLTSSRQTVEYRPVDRSRINKSRAKKRETPLLDHTEVVMHLNGGQVKGAPRLPLAYARKSPRIHFVSSYLARRGDKHWLVQPYVRGSGKWVARHTHVKG